MELTTYILTVAAVFLGIVAGYCLSLIAPEELLPGRKYLTPFRYIRYIYPLTGILLFAFRNHPDNFALIASLMFLLGLPVASYDATGFVKDEKIIGKPRLLAHLLLRYAWFIPIALLPLLFSYL